MIKSHYLQSAFKRCCLTLLFLATLNTKSFGWDFSVDNLSYDILSLEDKTCMVVYGYSKNNKAGVIIPDEVIYNDNNVSVIKIADRAFNLGYIYALTIPSSVIEVGEAACHGTTLSKVIFKENSLKKQPVVIGNSAFSDSRVSSVSLSSNINKIGDFAFFQCLRLSNINLEVSSITEIGESCFACTEKLESIIIPSTVHTIKAAAFSGSGIKNIAGGESVTSIGPSAFSCCESLKHLVIGKSLKVINENTYSWCSSLTDVTIPSTIEEIKSGAFWAIDMNSFKLEDCEQPIKFSTTEKVIANCGIHHIYLGRPLVIDNPLDKPCLAIGDNGTLELGKNINKLSSEVVGPYENIRILISHNLTPPTIPEMTNATYAGLKVRVPAEALEAYKQAPVWKNFWNIKAIEDESGISDIERDDDDSFQVYDTAGSLVDASCTSEKMQQLPHGVYIVVKQDKRMKIKI